MNSSEGEAAIPVCEAPNPDLASQRSSPRPTLGIVTRTSLARRSNILLFQDAAIPRRKQVSPPTNEC